VLPRQGFLPNCADLSAKEKAEIKNKETAASLFFFGFFGSKVIARVTRNSQAISCPLRAYLALRGCDHATDKSGVP